MAQNDQNFVFLENVKIQPLDSYGNPYTVKTTKEVTQKQANKYLDLAAKQGAAVDMAIIPRPWWAFWRPQLYTLTTYR